MKLVLCIEKFTMRNITFREGEAYIGNKVNDNYWVVESIGIPTEEFTLHFEIQDDIISGNSETSNDVTNKKFVEEEEMFKEILKSFGYEDMIEEETTKHSSWWEQIKEYIFL